MSKNIPKEERERPLAENIMKTQSRFNRDFSQRLDCLIVGHSYVNHCDMRYVKERNMPPEKICDRCRQVVGVKESERPGRCGSRYQAVLYGSALKYQFNI